nr:hypothetical protein [Tanacetum cinerariifolium]
LFIKQGAAKAGVTVLPGRGSVLTEALPGNKDRGACFFCGQCGRSCKVYGDFSASSCLVIPALKTGNLKEYEVKAKIVILGASAGESARLLLNSKSVSHPNGLANSSGVVGKYIHDSTGASLSGFLPQLMDRKRYNEDGVGSVGMAGRGTAIAREDNYCEIDPDVVDKYGIPVLRFHYKWTDAEIKQAKHMQETFQDIMHGMGGIITSKIPGADTNYGLEAPGRIIHEGDKNATWTILALSMRTSEYILDQRKRLILS